MYMCLPASGENSLRPMPTTSRHICIISAIGLHPSDAAPAEATASDVIPGLKLQVRHAPPDRNACGVGIGARMSGSILSIPPCAVVAWRGIA